MERSDVDGFFEDYGSHFLDPLTNSAPTNEREFGAVLQLKYNRQELDIEKIHVRDIRTGLICNLTQILPRDSLYLSEYPLFSKSQNEVDVWGQMVPDGLIVSKCLKSVILVECKIDSRFTHGDGPTTGQIYRYLKYLECLNVSSSAILLICPEFNVSWYGPRILRTLQGISRDINGYLATWESLVKAQRNYPAT